MRRTSLVLTLVVGLLALAEHPAFALSVDPDGAMNMVAGDVYALDVGGNWMYAGGKITAIRNVDNVDRCAADNLVRFNESTGWGDCTFTPKLPGTEVDAVAVMGSYVYVGGDFGLYRVSTSSGKVDSNFSPNVGNMVHTILPARNGSGVYIGGAFQRVNGVKRSRFAFIKTDGTLGTQAAAADNVVRRLRWSPAGYIVASGAFEHFGGNFDQSIAEINPDGTVRQGFSPDIAEIGEMTCFDTASTSSVIYAACGNSHNFMAAFDAGTGQKVWRKGLGGNAESIVLATIGSGSALFVGGHFGTRDPNSMPCGPNYLHGVLKADPATGTIDCSWDPHLIPDVNNFTGGWVERLVNGHLWLGGKFGKIDDLKHHGIARWTI
jgi:outer membrane protein assembly factor BamB